MKKIIISLMVFVCLMGWGGYSRAHLSYGDGEAIGLIGGALIQGCVALMANTRVEVSSSNPYTPSPPEGSSISQLPQDIQDKLWNNFQEQRKIEPNLMWDQFLARAGLRR